MFVAVMFLATAALAIFTGYRLLYGGKVIGGQLGTVPVVTDQTIPLGTSQSPVQTSSSMGATQFLISFFIASALMILFIRFFKGKLFFEICFAITIWFGAQVVLGAIMEGPIVYLLALAFVALRFLMPWVWMQNLALIVGIAGVSASLGLTFNWESIAVILAILSAYDIIAVYKTHHMQKMFKGLVGRGAILAMVIPEKGKDFFAKVTEIKPAEDKFIFLGTGDVALPVFFGVSVLPFGVLNSILVILGALGGMLVVHLLFTSQKERKPMPALPPIAAGAIIGFLISIR